MVEIPPIVRIFWWTLKLAPAGPFSTSLTYDDINVSELDPPPGYDPYTGKVNGSYGPFLSKEGAVLYSSPVEVRKASMVWTRLGEDVATASFSVLKLAESAPSADWGDADYDNVTAAIGTAWGELKTLYDGDTVFDRIVYHKESLAIEAAVKLFRTSHHTDGAPNPAVRTDAGLNVPGEAAERMLPPQCAISVTEKTTRRREWGRFYLPAPCTLALSEGLTLALGAGRIATSVVEGIRNTIGTLTDALVSHSVPMVVYSPTHGYALTVDQIQVDDLFDVIRSRRYDTAHVKATHSVG